MEILDILTELLITNFTLILVWTILTAIIKWWFIYTIIKHAVKNALKEYEQNY